MTVRFIIIFISIILVLRTCLVFDFQVPKITERRIVLSVGVPLAADIPFHLSNLDSGLTSATAIEYIDPSTRIPNEILSKWKSQGKLILARTNTAHTDVAAKTYKYLSLPELIHQWSRFLSDIQVDGISVDEFSGAHVNIISRWAEALNFVKCNFPNKLIFSWVSNWYLNTILTRQPDPQMILLFETLRDYSDYVILEVYYRTSELSTYDGSEFFRFFHTVEYVSKLAPGIENKILVCIGANHKHYNDTPHVNYSQFLSFQASYILNHERLRKLSGLAIYAPRYCTFEEVIQLDQTLNKFIDKHD